MDTMYIYPEHIPGMDLARMAMIIPGITLNDSTIFVTHRTVLNSRIASMKAMDVYPTNICKDNVHEVVELHVPGVYIITYERLRLLEGMRPFFNVVIYDETYKPSTINEQLCARLIRPDTKLVINFNKKTIPPLLDLSSSSKLDAIDEGFSALSCLQEMHEGDPDVEAWLKSIETALQHGLELKQTIIDMDKWVRENEGSSCCEYVDFDKEINTTKSYQIAKELTGRK